MQKIEISHRTIIFTVSLLLLLWGLYQVRFVILALFLSVILMAALNPAVDWLERRRIPRLVGILILYAVIIGSLSGGVVSVVPPLVEQTSKLLSDLPGMLDKLGVFSIDPSLYNQQLSRLPSQLFRVVAGAFSNLIGVFSVAVMTFYLLLERRNLKHHLTVLFGGDGEQRAEVFVDQIEQRLGGWVRGQIVLMILIGLLTYAGLRFLGVPFAVPLAIVAGILEIVPNIGPIVSMIPAVIVALTSSTVLAAAVLALYFVIQQAENNLIVPKVMLHAVGVRPLVTLLALMAGYQLAGIAGAILSLPTLLVAQVVISHFTPRPRVRRL